VKVGEAFAPDRNEEILLYQTLIGAWPFGSLGGEELPALRARMQAYLQKAVKEAKVHTSWVNPDDEWERAVQQFVAQLLDRERSERFWRDFLPFQRRIARVGVVNSLAQVALKVASPGVPDFYQGSELWDFSLVDPDNRRQVDFARRRGVAEPDARLVAGDRAGLSAVNATRTVWSFPPDEPNVARPVIHPRRFARANTRRCRRSGAARHAVA
jgi:(1->4)-alpha-D-glucan 1-alpha-D-glucosylmutase